MKQTNRNKIEKALIEANDWVSGYKIQQWAFEVGMTPETAMRECRRMEVDGILENKIVGRFVAYRVNKAEGDFKDDLIAMEERGDDSAREEMEITNNTEPKEVQEKLIDIPPERIW